MARTAVEKRVDKEFAQWLLSRQKATEQPYIGPDDGLTAQEIYDKHKPEGLQDVTEVVIDDV